MLASVAEQTSLSLTSSEPPKDTYSHDEAHLQSKIKNVKTQKLQSFHKYSVILAFFFLYKHKIYAGEA